MYRRFDILWRNLACFVDVEASFRLELCIVLYHAYLPVRRNYSTFFFFYHFNFFFNKIKNKKLN